MGYRSDIAFCLSVDTYKEQSGEWRYDKEKFKEMVGFFKLSKFYEEAVGAEYNLIKENNLGWQKGEIMFYAENWKWYPDYDIVKAFDEMWESMQNIEGISGYFCRVGEEMNDVVTDEFGDDPCYDYFQPFTSLSFEGDDYLGKRDTDEAETTQEDTAKPQPDCAGANHATKQECGKAQA
jgi:hypothetical protein